MPGFSPRHNLFLRISRQISRKHLCPCVISHFSKLGKVACPMPSLLEVVFQVKVDFLSLVLFLEARVRFLVVTFSGVGGSTYLLTVSFFFFSCSRFVEGGRYNAVRWRLGRFVTHHLFSVPHIHWLRMSWAKELIQILGNTIRLTTSAPP